VSEQRPAMHKFMSKTPADAPRFEKAWKAYTDQKETDMRDFFSRTYTYQGILGAFLLLVISRLLFRHVGLRFSTLILPVFSLLVGLALFFPLEIMVLQVLMVVGGSLNYSLNNATKELLYTVTSEDARFKLKPLIEGPVMRFGDVSASLIKLVLGFVLVNLLKSPTHYADWLSLVLALGVVAFWMVTISYTGGHYDQLKRKKSSE